MERDFRIIGQLFGGFLTNSWRKGYWYYCTLFGTWIQLAGEDQEAGPGEKVRAASLDSGWGGEGARENVAEDSLQQPLFLS